MSPAEMLAIASVLFMLLASTAASLLGVGLILYFAWRSVGPKD
jgi:hypothetical protein